jgi:Ca2+-binding EF-hand superfamily protein
MPITRTGVLNVKGAGRDNTQWEERTWKLDGAVLTSFNAEDADGKPKGRFELRDVSNLQFESKKRECNFELPQGKVRLRAETKSDAQGWYDSLKEAKDTQGASTTSSPLSPLTPQLAIRSPRCRVEEELQQKMRVKFQAAVAQTKDHTVEAVINKADKSGTGSLEREEFRIMCRKICKIPPKEVSDGDLDTFFDWITCDDEGVLHCEKMTEFIARRLKEEEPDDAACKMQIDQALHKLRARIKVQTKGDKDVEKLYHECDGNGDGTLDFSEFKRAIRKVLKIPAGELTDKTVLTLFRILDEGDEDCVSLMDFTEFVTNPEYSW